MGSVLSGALQFDKIILTEKKKERTCAVNTVNVIPLCGGTIGELCA